MGEGCTHFQVRAVVSRDVGTVTLRQDSDFLLNVFNLIFRLFKVDDLNGDHFLCALVDSLEDLAKRSLPDALQLGERLFRVDFVLRTEVKL